MDICNCCIDKHGLKDLNGMNNCCYNACARRMGLDNINDVKKTECGKACKECIDMSKLAQGRSLCYMRNVQPPVIWEGFDPSYAKNEPLSFYAGYIFSGVFLVFFLFIVITVIFSNKK